MFTARTELDSAAAAGAISDAMEALDPPPGAVATSEEPDGSGHWVVVAYFEETPDATDLALLSAGFGAAAFEVAPVPDEDWVARVQRELSPVEAGRFYVHGSHDKDAVPRGRVSLLIDAAMAFGTGHHGTTKACLLMFERLAGTVGVPASVADIGCGTAVLAMAAAKAGSRTVVAGDNDPVAVGVAAENVAANGLEGRVGCVVAEGFAHPAIEAHAPYDLVFANILKGPLIELAPDMAAATHAGGHVILSGLLIGQADEISDVYSRSGFNMVDRINIGEWTCLLARR